MARGELDGIGEESGEKKDDEAAGGDAGASAASQAADQRRSRFQRKSQSLDDADTGRVSDEEEDEDDDDDEEEEEEEEDGKSFALLEAMASVYRQLLSLSHDEVRGPHSEMARQLVLCAEFRGCDTSPQAAAAVTCLIDPASTRT